MSRKPARLVFQEWIGVISLLEIWFVGHISFYPAASNLSFLLSPNKHDGKFVVVKCRLGGKSYPVRATEERITPTSDAA